LNSASLLILVHNGHKDTTDNSTEGLRKAIQKKKKELQEKITEYKNCHFKCQVKFQLEFEIKKLLSRKSSYTMLSRSINEITSNQLQFLFD
jgi:hypothetical protein